MAYLPMANDPDKIKGKKRINRLTKLHGTDEPFPRTRALRAGMLTMTFESGAVRNITLGETEVIRMIYAAVRDEHWMTVQPEISGERITRGRKGFTVGFDARYRYGKIDFAARYVFKALDDHRVIFEMEGKALSTFMKNRIGFCILHPIEPCAGTECRITHPDGSQTRALFPREIAPHQPFGNISSMQWKINGHADAILRFYGDLFETEDQRNWTDASFKTYSTPLELPYPVEVKKGTKVYQKLELEIRGALHEHRLPENKVVFQVNTGNSIPLPLIGTGMSSRLQPISTGEAMYLKRPGFSHLRAELHLFSPNLENQFGRMAAESSLLEIPVELCLLFGNSNKGGLQEFLTHFHRHPVRIKSITLLSQQEKSTPPDLIQTVTPDLKMAFPGIPVGAGTNCNFAQLNRNRPDPGTVDFLSFAIHPQEHAGDDKSLFENAAAQQFTVITAQQFARHKPIHISPVTLQRRFNANAANYEEAEKGRGIPPQVDARQMSLAGAAWTTGSLKYLLESGAGSVTYYETVGERGLMMGDHASAWPLEFPAKKAMIFPVFHVFRMLLSHAGYRTVKSFSNKPLEADGFTVISDDHGLVFLANMTHLSRQVKLEGITGVHTLLVMNATTFLQIVRPGSVYPARDYFPLNEESTLLRLQPYETRILKFPLK